MLFNLLVALTMATLSCARPWYNTTSVAAYGTGYGTGLVGTAPYAHHASTKAAEAHAAGCSVSYVTVTSTPVSATTDGPLSPATSVEKYSYAINSGTTSWFNGVSPPATEFDSTVQESSTVVVGTITATTYSTTTEIVQSSSKVCTYFFKFNTSKVLVTLEDKLPEFCPLYTVFVSIVN